MPASDLETPEINIYAFQSQVILIKRGKSSDIDLVADTIQKFA